MDFEILKELVQTVTKNKIKQIEVLGNPGQGDSKTEDLYEGIAKGKINSDEAIARSFFGVDDPRDRGVQKLKNKLFRQLVNTAIFIDTQQPLFSDRTKAFYNSYRDFVVAYILMTRNARKAAMLLLHQVLEQAEKFEFIELATEITRQLRNLYSRGLADRLSHQKFSEMHRQYEEKRRLEMQASEYYEELLNYYMVRRSPNEEVHELAKKYYQELLPLAPKADTSQFYFHAYNIGIICHLAENNYRATLELCDKTLEMLTRRKNINRGALFTTALQKLACLTHLRLFENNLGDETAAYCLQFTEAGELNWYRVHEAYMYYCLYNRRYEQALAIFKDAVTHPQFKSLPGNILDEWKLFGGYLQLLAKLGKLDNDEVQAIAGPYKQAKYVNDFEIVDKDKEGMNIPLVLLPLLYHLAQKNYEEFSRVEEALDKYRKRYLENDINYRSARFVKLLMLLPKKPFDPAGTEKKITKELALLKEAGSNTLGQSFVVEIIPYEDLWDMLSTH